MSVLGFRAFASEFIKIATEIRDADIRAMLADRRGEEYLEGGRLPTNTEIETNFKPKLAGIPSFLRRMTKKDWGVTNITKWPKDSRLQQRLSQWQAGKQYPLAPKSNRSNPEWVADYRKAHADPPPGSQIDAWKKNHDKLKTASGFMAITPVGTYNVIGNKKKQEAKPAGSAYENVSGTVGTALKGGLTGGAVGALGKHILHGPETKLLPKHLGALAAAGAGLSLTDRALRRRAVKKQLEKTANLPTTFSPARQLHATQQQGSFQNKVHHTPLKAPAGLVGKEHRLPDQGA